MPVPESLIIALVGLGGLIIGWFIARYFAKRKPSKVVHFNRKTSSIDLDFSPFRRNYIDCKVAKDESLNFCCIG